mgnify:CR=1 FL=1
MILLREREKGKRQGNERLFKKIAKIITVDLWWYIWKWKKISEIWFNTVVLFSNLSK